MTHDIGLLQWSSVVASNRFSVTLLLGSNNPYEPWSDLELYD